MLNQYKNTDKFWITGLIITSYLNTILRFSTDGSITVFRMLLPLVFLYYIRKNTNTTIKYLLASVFIVGYSYVISYLPFNRFSNFDVVFTLHYILVPFCFLLTKFFIDLVGVSYLYKLFKYMHYIMLLLAFIQFLVGGVYPNTQDRSPMINIFFWNENEFASVLAIFLPLYIIKERFSLVKFICVISSLFFVVYSDARLLIIGLVFFFLCYYSVLSPLYRYNKGLWYGIASILFVAVSGYLSQMKIFDEYTFFEIFVEPFHRIYTLTPYEGIGSLAARINAYVWGISELIKTYLFGIGPGNSLIVMMEMAPRGMFEFSAKSFHNILLQMVVELGIVGLVMLISLFKWMKKVVRQSGYQRIIVIGYYVSGIICSMILSGAFSNYAFIFIFAFSSGFFVLGEPSKDILKKS